MPVLPLPPLISEGDFGFTSGYTGTQRFLALAEPPTAIVAASDVAAFGVIEECIGGRAGGPHRICQSSALTTSRKPPTAGRR